MRILLGCELGQNAGHIGDICRIACHLIERGHEVAFALPKRFTSRIKCDSRILYLRSPEWHHIGRSIQYGGTRQSSTMTDVLVLTGIDQPDCLSSVIKAWDHMLTHFQPDIVIADYAPGLLTAASNRLPAFGIGTGFTCPPAHLKCFPHLIDNDENIPNEKTLEIVNLELSKCGRGALERLPALFDTQDDILITLPELDPYVLQRKRANYVMPGGITNGYMPELSTGLEVFVYSYNFIPSDSKYWLALAATDLNTRVYMHKPTANHLSMFARYGFAYEPNMVSHSDILRRSCVVACHGGHGLVMSCLLMGIPTVSTYLDLEKYLNGKFISQLEVGTSIPFAGSKPLHIADLILETSQSKLIRNTLKSFTKKLSNRPTISLLAAIDALLSRA